MGNAAVFFSSILLASLRALLRARSESLNCRKPHRVRDIVSSRNSARAHSTRRSPSGCVPHPPGLSSLRIVALTRGNALRVRGKPRQGFCVRVAASGPVSECAAPAAKKDNAAGYLAGRCPGYVRQSLVLPMWICAIPLRGAFGGQHNKATV